MVENKPLGRSEIADRQAEEKALRQQTILKAALKVFADKGYAETSMADIGRAARLGKATLYYYFPTKDALYQAIYVRGMDAYYSNMMPALETEQPTRIFKTMLTFYVAYMTQHRDFLKIFYPLGRSAPLQIVRSLEVQTLHKQHRDRLDQILRDKLQMIHPEKQELVVQILWTFIMGLSSKLLRQTPVSLLLNEIETINSFMLQFVQA